MEQDKLSVFRVKVQIRPSAVQDKILFCGRKEMICVEYQRSHQTVGILAGGEREGDPDLLALPHSLL